jgi:hypothetical protein
MWRRGEFGQADVAQAVCDDPTLFMELGEDTDSVI